MPPSAAEVLAEELQRPYSPQAMEDRAIARLATEIDRLCVEITTDAVKRARKRKLVKVNEQSVDAAAKFVRGQSLDWRSIVTNFGFVVLGGGITLLISIRSAPEKFAESWWSMAGWGAMIVGSLLLLVPLVVAKLRP